MNRILSCLLFICMATNASQYQLNVNPSWQMLNKRTEIADQLGGNWVLVGILNFKKKTRETIFLDQLEIMWEGEPLASLPSTLYKKQADKPFIPLQDYVICDGIWNAHRQEIVFKFEKPYQLNGTTCFYLVLTIPDHLEPVIRKGIFNIKHTALPELFKTCLKSKRCSLSFETVPMQLTL
jgi:hypothetical protein